MPSKVFDPGVWQAAKDEMRAICIMVCRLRGTITYGEVAARMQAISANPGSYVFQAILRDMCREEENAGRGMLCAVVVQKATGHPGAGFFKAVVQRRANCTDDGMDCWRAECEQLYDYWTTHPDEFDQDPA
jgi:hypothetical protein